MATNMFEGTKVRLRGVNLDDWRHFLAWDQDSDAQRNGWHIWPPYGEEAAKEFARQESAKKPTDANMRLMIETLTGVAVGSLNIRPDARRFNFEYGINVAREHWGKGFAEEALVLIFRYLFGELRMHKAQAWVYAYNERSAAFHRKFGMVLEGTMREGQFANGQFWDVYIFGMTAGEFAERYGGPA